MTFRARIGIAALAAVPIAVLVLFFLYPVSGMVGRGLWPDGKFQPGAVLSVLARDRVHRVLWFTVWSAGAATVLSVVLGVPVAFVLHRLRFPGIGLLRSLVVLPFVLPTVVVGVAFRHLIAPSGPLGGLHLDGTAVGERVSREVGHLGGRWAGVRRRPHVPADGLE